MRIGLAQINPIVGDIEGNTVKILDNIARAEANGAELVVFPELAVFGYPPKDLVLRKDIVGENFEAMQKVAAACTRVTAVVGYAHPDPSGAGKGVLNAAGICRNGRLETWYAKMLLPTYDVFDEARYFNTGHEVRLFDFTTGAGKVRAGITICEDLWNNQQFEGRQVYGIDPIELTVRAGANLLINLSASPYRAGVEPRREQLFAAQLREHRVPLVYVNQVGGNDDLVFDGASMVMDARGNVIARAKAFEEDLLIADLEQEKGDNRIEPQPDFLEGIRKALVLGTRDYVAKCGFREVVLGLSGGIDSAVTAAIAVDALGADRVHAVAMPSRFNSPHSLADAQSLAKNLGIHCRVIPLETAHRAMEATLTESFASRQADVTEENMQSRIRGGILMALSNKFGWMLLTTGNKSELAVGYCTLYGDMCGGLAMLSDVPKTTVYDLARRINQDAGRELIPRRTIERAPSAELRENQTDQDALPPYEVLDDILEQYIEQDRSPAEIVAMGFDQATVERVTGMVRASEHKRKQSAVGLKVTSRAFGTGRRFPIAAKYR
jgi:NAD+ synthase (glutamine-hydrolysing)